MSYCEVLFISKMAIFMYICFTIFVVLPNTLALVPDKEHRSETSYNDAKIWRRFKGDPECGPESYDFQCTDGTCLSADKKCDGIIDCPDGTDEKYHICRNMRCPYHHFRCTYGACVDRTASCNGVSECADDSDELQPACRNDNHIMGDKFKCNNGELIEVYQRCDGTAECSDSTDESLATCASVVCPSHLFQCAYGACVDSGADCNNLQECADGSDESDLLCNRTSVTTTTTTTTEPSPSTCILPNHPKYGIYRMTDGAKYIKYIPGSVHESLVVLNATCYPGFKVVGDDLLYCHEGFWSSEFPKCARTCKLEKSQSVEYRCITGDEHYEGTRECEEYEVEGTMVQPECRKPNYYSPTDLYYMLCLDGEWNYKPRCEPECGTLTPRAQPLVLGGRAAAWGEVPWYAGLYSKRSAPPTLTCGATLLTETVLVSAAHCVWFSRQTEPVEDYAVAVGKLYREWGHPYDLEYEQTSDVKSIYVSRYYRGAILNYQHDIAILVVSQPFSYRPYIRPLCINFPQNFNDMQLKNGEIGKVAGFGLTTVFTGSESPKLKVLDMPYVDFDECLLKTPGYIQDYFSGDKICGGFTNGTSLCKGDSGGGFAFPMEVNGRTRFFLRGIVSTSPPLPGGFSCNSYTFTSFTDVMQHKNFIMMHLH